MAESWVHTEEKGAVDLQGGLGIAREGTFFHPKWVVYGTDADGNDVRVCTKKRRRDAESVVRSVSMHISGAQEFEQYCQQALRAGMSEEDLLVTGTLSLLPINDLVTGSFPMSEFDDGDQYHVDEPDE